MTRYFFRLAAVAAAGFAAAPAPAQTQPAAPATPDAIASPRAQTMRARDVLGTGVAVQGNNAVGTVHDLIFNDAGMIEFVLVADAGKLTSVPWRAVRFDLRQRTSTLQGVTPEQYRAAPTFAQDQYPDFYAPEYRAQTYKYYGLNPTDPSLIDRGVISGARRENPPIDRLGPGPDGRLPPLRSSRPEGSPADLPPPPQTPAGRREPTADPVTPPANGTRTVPPTAAPGNRPNDRPVAPVGPGGTGVTPPAPGTPSGTGPGGISPPPSSGTRTPGSIPAPTNPAGPVPSGR